jgi:hypothetical protein
MEQDVIASFVQRIALLSCRESKGGFPITSFQRASIFSITILLFEEVGEFFY